MAAELSQTGPYCSDSFYADLATAKLGLAAQVLLNWSNYPVLCHTADELITSPTCFPLSLESPKTYRVVSVQTHTHTRAHTSSSSKITRLNPCYTNTHTFICTYPQGSCHPFNDKQEDPGSLIKCLPFFFLNQWPSVCVSSLCYACVFFSFCSLSKKKNPKQVKFTSSLISLLFPHSAAQLQQ